MLCGGHLCAVRCCVRGQDSGVRASTSALDNPDLEQPCVAVLAFAFGTTCVWSWHAPPPSPCTMSPKPPTRPPTHLQPRPPTCLPRALEALLTEAARVRLHGLSEGEFSRAVKAMEAQASHYALARYPPGDACSHTLPGPHAVVSGVGVAGWLCIQPRCSRTG